MLNDGNQTLPAIAPFSGTSLISWDYLQVNFGGTSYYSFADGLLGKYLKIEKAIQCPKFDIYNVPITKVPETYGICGVSLNNIGQLTQGADTAMFADLIRYGLAGFSRPTEIFKPSQGQDSFHGRHSNGVGNVALYDGHVQAITSQALPINLYSAQPSAPIYAVIKAQHIGPLFKSMDFSQMGSSTVYVSACQNIYDYYFWANKNQRQ